MKKVTLAIAMAALVLLAGCKKDKETTGTTLTASIEQQSGNGSRTSIHPVADDQAEIHWTAGDKIVVNNGTSSQTFNLTAGAGGKTGTFTYNGEYTFSDNNIAVYPETATISGNDITVTLPAEKTVVPNANIGQNPMMGTFRDPNDLTFTSICGVLGISLTGSNVNITAVEIVSNANEKLNGSFTCTTSNPQISVADATDESSRKMRLNCTTKLTSGAAQNFYFPLPVGALTQGFTLNVYGAGNEPFFSKRTDNSNSIVGNKLNKMPDVQVPPEGAINSLFSVSANKKVYFSQGNLQYIGSAATPYWKFADNQWECLGDTGQGSASETANRDLFGWGTSDYEHGATCWQPWSSSNDNSEYNPYNSTSTNLYDGDGTADWGYNAISNGGNRENSDWCTLTQSEWDYLINGRTNGYTKNATVAGKIGIIIYPDNYSGSAVSNPSEEEWAACEAAGCVFLPKAGYRDGTSVDGFNQYGEYWSATLEGDSWAYYFTPDATPTPHCYSIGRGEGAAVRLVQDVQ